MRPAYAHASIRFTVPDVEPGEYEVFVCNAGCKLTLGDLITSLLTVAATPGEARILADIDQRLDALDEAVSRTRTTADEPSASVDGASRDWVMRLEAQLTLMQEDLDAMRDDLAAANGRVPLAAGVTALALLAAFAVVTLVRRRRTRPNADSRGVQERAEPVPTETDDELVGV